MAFAAARMILKDKRRKTSKEDFTPRNRSKVIFKNITLLCLKKKMYAARFIEKTKKSLVCILLSNVTIGSEMRKNKKRIFFGGGAGCSVINNTN